MTIEPTDDPIAAVLDEFRKKVNAELMGKPLNQAIAEPMAKEIVLLRSALNIANRTNAIDWVAENTKLQLDNERLRARIAYLDRVVDAVEQDIGSDYMAVIHDALEAE